MAPVGAPKRSPAPPPNRALVPLVVAAVLAAPLLLSLPRLTISQAKPRLTTYHTFDPAEKELLVSEHTQLAEEVAALENQLRLSQMAQPQPPQPQLSSAQPPQPSSTSQPQPQPAQPLKPCAAGCAGRGTCNAQLGRCDCPPYLTGDDCAAPLFPACARQWGLEVGVAPVGIVQPAFPASCECVWQARQLRLDARQECLVEPSGEATMEAAAAAVKANMPWMPHVANESALRRTRDDASRTRRDKLCSGRGIHSPQLPFHFYPAGNPEQRTPVCRCFVGWTGPRCERRSSHKCLNECSGRGQCVHNWCRCDAGSWGADCSLPAGHPQSGGSLSTPARPRIYVYDMPPRFTTWLATFRKGDWTRDHWYGVDVMLHQQLLRSRHRTLDPEEADYFYIPLYLSLGFYSHRYYFKHFTHTAQPVLREALAYVRATWPRYWQRRGGSDHLLVMTQDQGTRFVLHEVPEAAPLIFIHHWGAPRTVVVEKQPQGDHRPRHDIVVPPFHAQQAHMNRWLETRLFAGSRAICPPNAPSADPRCAEQPSLRADTLLREPAAGDFKRLLFFSGKMNFQWGRHYSLGVRQAVWEAFRNDSRFLVIAQDKGVQQKLPFEQHIDNYASSKFCLAPAGYGFSSRQYECVLVGCVPVVIQDDVEMAFEEVLPWHRFSVRLNFSQIPQLPQILSAIPPHEVARMRRGLGCVWPRMLWLAPGLYEADVDASPTVGAARRHDAFETLMWSLRRRLKLPGADAERWRVEGASCVGADEDERRG